MLYNPVPAFVLGLIERHIRGGCKRCGGPVVGNHGCQAAADRDFVIVRITKGSIAYLLPYLIADFECPGGRGIAKKDRELVAADPVDADIVRPYTFEDAGKVLEDAVAGGMPEPVVHEFKFVDIDHRGGGRRSAVATFPPHFFEIGIKCPSIQKSRKRVKQELLLHIFLRVVRMSQRGIVILSVADQKPGDEICADKQEQRDKEFHNPVTVQNSGQIPFCAQNKECGAIEPQYAAGYFHARKEGRRKEREKKCANEDFGNVVCHRQIKRDQNEQRQRKKFFHAERYSVQIDQEADQKAEREQSGGRKQDVIPQIDLGRP